MHFIEEFFGVSPDGGSGSLELILLAVPLVLALLIFARHLHSGAFSVHSGGPEDPHR